MLRKLTYLLFKPSAPIISPAELTHIKKVIVNGINANNLKIYQQTSARVAQTD